METKEVLERQRKYREAIATFTPQINPTSPNYVRTIEWAKANGYTFKTDVSYNGFIYMEKFICDKDSRIELQIYDGIIKVHAPRIEVDNLEADFGSIFAETKYYYKTQRGLRLDPHTLDELFAIAVETEQKWEAEWVEILKNK